MPSFIFENWLTSAYSTVNPSYSYNYPLILIITGLCLGIIGLNASVTPRSYRGSEMVISDVMSVSLVEETGVPGGNHRPTASGQTHKEAGCEIPDCISEVNTSNGELCG